MKSRILLTAAAVMLAAYSTGAYAKTQVQWWHAMGGELGAKLEEIVKGYNASQDEYEVVPVYKGSFPETMTAVIAAFRAGEQPAIVQVFEVGTGTMMAAKGAVYPAYKLMEDAGEPFDPKGFLQAVVGYYTDTDGNMLSMPFNSSTPIVYYNKDVFKKAGLDPETSPKTWGDIEEFSKKIMTSRGCVLVGPSGCGKSTLLRMVAGLESITSGTVMIDDAVVNDREPAERDIAMVFQSCALYPHMKVYDNMAYGLRNRGMARGEIDRRVREAARILELSQLLERRPRELSGGQRRRVAMGRAIVPSPKVFLFDEPLSNLDAELRGQMRVEIRNLQKRIGVTSVYVTHDQVDAMTLADKLVVMNNGLAEQIGTSLEIYSRPASTFVASFIGSPAMNLVEAAVDGTGVGLRIGDATMALRGVSLPASEPMIFGVRPEHLRLAAGRGDLELTVEAAEALGADTLAHQRQRQRGGNAGGAAPRRDEGGGRGRFAADL